MWFIAGYFLFCLALFLFIVKFSRRTERNILLPFRDGYTITVQEKQIIDGFNGNYRDDLLYNKFFRQETGVLFVEVLRNLKHKTEDTVFIRNVYDACAQQIRLEWGLRDSDPGLLPVLHEHIDKDVWKLITDKIGVVQKINEAGRKLYNRNPDAWTIRYKILTGQFELTKAEEFYLQVCSLANYNQSRVTIARDIYYSAHIFVVAKQKEIALRFYLQYLHVKTYSDTFKHKKISRKNSKHLFATKEEEAKFDRICQKLLRDKKIDTALRDLHQLCIIKRKTIQLNRDAIVEAGKKQAKVASLLGNILTEDEAASPLGVQVIQTPVAAPDNGMNNREELVNLFIRNNFRLDKAEVDIFARSKGVLANQLIQGINEDHYEELDDVLIEEDDSHFLLNEDYLQQLRG